MKSNNTFLTPKYQYSNGSFLLTKRYVRDEIPALTFKNMEENYEFSKTSINLSAMRMINQTSSFKEAVRFIYLVLNPSQIEVSGLIVIFVMTRLTNSKNSLLIHRKFSNIRRT